VVPGAEAIYIVSVTFMKQIAVASQAEGHLSHGFPKLFSGEPIDQ
jgi:hypothetical protein